MESLKIQGMTCANCAMSVQKSLERAGAEEVQVNFSLGEAHFKMPEKLELSALQQEVEKLGFQTVKESDQQATLEAEQLERKRLKRFQLELILAITLSIPLLLSMIPGLHFLHEPRLQLALCLPVMIIGWRRFGPGAFSSIRIGVPNMDVLILLGSSAAFFYSLLSFYRGDSFLFFETAATIISLVMLGHWLEERALQQSTSALRALTALQVQDVWVQSVDKNWISKNVAEVEVGSIIRVREQERVPLDCVVLESEVEIDESFVSGESLPKLVEVGQHVFGGSQLLSELLIAEVVSGSQEGLLSQIIRMVKEASSKKAPIQSFADRISAVFVPSVVAIALATFLISTLIFNLPTSQALIHAVAVLVISCPCAMGLATPTAISVALGRAARLGILIKGPQALQNLAQVKTIILDKTGTLTEGKFNIQEIHCTGISETEARSVILSLSKNAQHPISKSLTELLSPDTEALFSDRATEVKGYGVEAMALGHQWALGSKRWLQGEDLDLANDNWDLFLYKDHQVIASIRLEDKLRPQAEKTVEQLKALKLNVLLISGDRTNKVQDVAERLGIDNWHAEQLPQQKMEHLQQLKKQGLVAMLGDGINDAPALELADVGISLEDGSGVAKQAADMVLLGKDLGKLSLLFSLSRKTLSTIKQNLFWAFFYNVLAIPVAAVGLLSPMIAAAAMGLSDLIVIGNSLRLRIQKLAISWPR
jgi:Cu+-exporting ATPase